MNRLAVLPVALLLIAGDIQPAPGQTIFEAVRAQDAAQVRQLLEADPALANARDQWRRTPLHYASSRGASDIASLLIAANADVNAREYEEHTPLHWAAVRDHLAVVELLIDVGADLEAANDYGRTPLILVARESGGIEASRLLLDAGADPDATDRPGASALELAAWRGFEPLVNLLLDWGAALPSDPERMDRLTTYSVRAGLEQLFLTLARRRMNPDLRNENGGTLLHSAAAGGSVPIASALLERAVDVNARDRYGRTPLHYAAERERLAMIELLLAHGAEVDTRSRAGYTPHAVARRQARTEAMTALAAAGADTALAPYPIPNGPYLGQPAPGVEPRLFAPDIVASHRFEHGTVTFSSAGDVAVWETAFPSDEPGYARGTLVASYRVDGGWTEPAPLPFSDPSLGDDVPFFHPDGSKLFLLSTRPLEGEQAGGERIWSVDRDPDGWGTPQLISGGPNAMTHHWQFAVASDGSIYFSSGDPGGLGDGDLYVSRFEDGRYLAPENLGAPVNSEADETQPYLSPDGRYLLFGRPQAGAALDLWVSFSTPDGWSQPRNLGPAVNSTAQDICPIVSPDGRYLFFNSYRDGNADNYWVDASVIEALRTVASPDPDRAELTYEGDVAK